MVKGRVAPLDAEAVPARRETAPQRSLVAMLQRYRDFRLLLLGTLATQAGQWILNVAMAWLVLELTNSAIWVGLLGFAGGLPMLFISIPAGVMIDRRDRRLILLWCQVLLTTLAAGLTILVLLDVIAPWQLLLGALFNGAFMAVNNATRQAIVPNAVDPGDLAGGFGLLTAGQNASRIIGPSIAGVLLGFYGAAGAFAFQTVVLLAALLLTVALSGAIAGEGRARVSSGRPLDGLAYVRRRPVIRDLLLLAAIPMITVFPYVQLLPIFARDILDIGASGLGLMMAVSGVGAVIGGLLTSASMRIARIGPFLLLTTIAYGGIVAAFAFSHWLWLSLPLIAMGSLTGSLFMAVNNTLVHMQVTDEVRGRVTGVYMLTQGLFPLGVLPMAIGADLVGAPLSVATAAALSSAGALLLAFLSPALWRLRRGNLHTEPA